MARLSVCLLLILILGSFLVKAVVEEDSEAVEDQTTPAPENPEENKEEPPQNTDEAIKEDSAAENAEEVTERPACEPTKPTKPKHGVTKRTTRVPSKRSKKKEEEDSEEDTSQEQDDEYDREDKAEVTLTKAVCKNALIDNELTFTCCNSQMFLDTDVQFCVRDEDVSILRGRNHNKALRLSVKIIECFFRRKKYIRARNRLNMKKIREDAAKFKNPVLTEFMIQKYTTCGILAKGDVGRYHDMGDRFPLDLRNRHEVFVFSVYTCLENYLQKQECPYFAWFGLTRLDYQKCMEYAGKCEKMMKH